MMNVWRCGAVCWAAGFWLAAGAQGQSLAEAVRPPLGRILERQSPPAELVPYFRRNTSLWSMVRRFYTLRAGGPAWVGPSGQAQALLRVLESAASQGLDSSDYPIGELRVLLGRPMPDADTLALLDAAATTAFFGYGADLAFGRVAPAAVDTMWAAAPRAVDLIGRLTEALDSGRVDAMLQSLAPPQGGAARLRAALARYRDIEARGGWSEVPAGPPLMLGAEGRRVEALRRRLAATGDLAAGGGGGSGGGGDVFDVAVQDAVERMQASYGLEMDGIVGPATLAALNVPVAERIHQMELNLERWRWLPAELGDRYITVNSAAFTLQVVDAGCTILVAPVIAGRVDWPTPITSGTLTDVVFHPRWNIPRSIAVREILPIVRRDPGYLAREGIHVMSDATDRAVEIDPTSIPWNAIVDTAFSYQLWQESGPKNPLGRIRFGVSNRFGVALHDTPNQASFTARRRVLSHGCVRVAGAQDLAVYVLARTPGWGENAVDSVQTILSGTGERWIAVPQPVAVYLSYWTAWVDDDGAIQFRPDVYGWDAKLAAALRGTPRDRSSSATRSTPRS